MALFFSTRRLRVPDATSFPPHFCATLLLKAECVRHAFWPILFFQGSSGGSDAPNLAKAASWIYHCYSYPCPYDEREILFGPYKNDTPKHKREPELLDMWLKSNSRFSCPGKTFSQSEIDALQAIIAQNLVVRQ